MQRWTMFQTMRTRTAAGAACLAIALTGANALAQANEPQTLLAFQHEGLDGLIIDDKDAGLRAALQMLPSRLKELHATANIQREVPWFTPEFVDLGWDMFTRPMRMIVTNRGADPNTGQPLIGAIISVRMPDAATAQSHHQRLVGLIREQARGADLELKDSRRIAGMTDIATPTGPLSFGPRDAADGWRYEILFGATAGPDRAFDAMPTLDAGATTTASFVLDLGAISPLIQPFVGMMAMGAPQGQQMIEQFGAMGLIGPNALRIEGAVGHTPTHTLQRITVFDAKKNADALGISTEPLTQEALAMIPRDATAVSIWNSDPMQAWNRFIAQMGPGAEAEIRGVIDQVQQQIGVHPIDDILATLGTTGAMYLSDSTGGGSIMSAVGVMSLKDRARLNNSIDKLVSLANGVITEEANLPEFLSIRFVKDNTNAGSMVRLRFDGLPIPVMPSFTLTENHLVGGLTPQGTRAAAAQVTRRANDSILANAAFAENMGRWRSPVAVGFIDNARTIRDGYGLVQFGTTGLETFVSSPLGGRVAPEILPTLPALMQNARPFIQVSFWDGDDFVTEYTSDRSYLVSAAGFLGVGDTAPLIIGGLIGSGITAAIMENMDNFDDQWDFDESDMDWDDDDDVDF
ncbi:MAG: hypothetical protein ACTS3F_14165 [Phycisphaerales bacterium]